MPRITVEGGPSNAAALPGEVGHMPPAGAGPGDAPVEEAPQDAPEAPGPGGAADVPGVAHVSRAPIVADPVTPEADAPHYASMTKGELVDEAKSRELPVGGTKADLAGRLTEHDAAQLPAEAQAVLAEGGD
jgi:hypothetical protein